MNLAMNRRGLTLVEFLLSLVLLSGLLLAVAHMLRTSATLFNTARADHRWESAATAAMNRIADDLMCNDTSDPINGPNAIAAYGSLRIRTRCIIDGSPPIHQVQYSLNPATRRLRRIPVGSGGEPAVILGRVSGFHARVGGRLLYITIESDFGPIIAREIPLL